MSSIGYRLKSKENYFAFILVILSFGCSTQLDTEKVYEIYSPPIVTNSKLYDTELNRANRQNNILKLKSFKIYFRLFDNGLLNGVLETDNKVYSYGGDYTYWESTKTSNESYDLDFNAFRNNFYIKLDNETKSANAAYGIASNAFERLNSTFQESDLSVAEFNSLWEQGSTEEFIPNSGLGDFDSDDLSNYWLSYFGFDDIVELRINREEAERLRRLEQEEKRANAVAQRESRNRRLNLICNSIKNFDVKNYLLYDSSATSKDLETARNWASGKKVGQPKGNIYMPKSRYSIGYILEEGYFITSDGKPYTGPFTYTFRGNLYIGILNYHGLFGRLSLAPGRSINDLSQFYARCDI